MKLNLCTIDEYQAKIDDIKNKKNDIKKRELTN